MAKTIEFPDIEPRLVFDRDCVVFPALVDGRPIRCMVTFEALMQDYGAKRDSDFLEAFRRNRGAFEKQIRSKLAAGIVPEEVIIKSSREVGGHRIFQYVPSEAIKARDDIFHLLHDITVDYLGRASPHSCNTRVQWDMAHKGNRDIYWVVLNDVETGGETTDFFTHDQLTDPEYLRHRFNVLWSEYLSARSARQLEKLRSGEEGS